jgi:hypothetical protein
VVKAFWESITFYLNLIISWSDLIAFL